MLKEIREPKPVYTFVFASQVKAAGTFRALFSLSVGILKNSMQISRIGEEGKRYLIIDSKNERKTSSFGFRHFFTHIHPPTIFPASFSPFSFL